MNTDTTQPAPSAESTPSVEESQGLLSGIVEAPPSPMPIPAAGEASVPSPAPSRVDPERFSKYRDYKKRMFDPRLHKVKADGSPELTSEGKLKLLPPSRRGEQIARKIESLFVAPPSDHVLDAEEEAVAVAQADGAAMAEERENRAIASAELYFGIGAALFSTGFLRRKKERRPRIVSACEEYERRTGKAVDLPPGLAFAAVLMGDISEQVATEPECSERVGAIKGFIFKQAAKSAVKESWFGRLFRRSPRQLEPEPEHAERPASPATVNASAG